MARARRGFTLVEILVVITIIAVLAGLVSVVAVRVLDTAKQTRIKTELDALDMAMKAYKEKYGAYPPCDLRITGTSLIALRAHIARAFPRYTGIVANDLPLTGVDTVNFRPDQAVVFWLRGFGPDVTNPFVTVNDVQIAGGTVTGVTVTRTQLFDFDRTRLAQAPSPGIALPVVPSYFPAGPTLNTATSVPFPQWTSGGAPYVYFDSFNYSPPPPPVSPVLNTQEAIPRPFNFTSTTPSVVPIFANAGTAVPYWLDTNANGRTNTAADMPPAENWANPTTFQIIATGMDGKYGVPVDLTVGNPLPKNYPSALGPTGGSSYDLAPPNGNLADDDNLTNFCPKARLSDAKP